MGRWFLPCPCKFKVQSRGQIASLSGKSQFQKGVSRDWIIVLGLPSYEQDMTPRKTAGDRGIRANPFTAQDLAESVVRSRFLDKAQSQKQVEQLVELAQRGLPQMRVGDRFVQTARSASQNGNSALRIEGENLRYAAIVTLGAAYVDDVIQRQIFGGSTAAGFAPILVEQAQFSRDPGAIALVAWAAAEVAGLAARDIFERLRMLLANDRPIPTVDCAWALSAALAARHLAETDDISLTAARRLSEAQSPSGLFPHMLPRSAGKPFRAHVGCFADQVYPIQSLARFSAVWQDEAALAAANACAAQICKLQGSNGQWWWHYDTRTGGVVEGYPVYSVHQHAMAPMALFDLLEAGGSDFRPAIARGLNWLYAQREAKGELICEEHGLVWRKVGRREPRKAVRSMAAFATSLNPGIRMSLLEHLFPPTRIDYECRPYELGWLLYAWRSGGVVDALREKAGSPALSRRDAVPHIVPAGQPLFGFKVDALRMDEVIARSREAIATRKPLLLGMLNAAKVVKARKDPALYASLLECDLLLADGQSIVWASRLLGLPLPERVNGTDTFENLLALADREGLSVYLLGAKPEVLALLKRKLQRDFPRMRIAGCRDGYFSDDEAAAIAEDIRASGADMLFLGISTPKKEKFLAAFKERLGVPVLHGVGGSFDVLAGITKRAPKSWQRLGMEWAFRLLQEPRRMLWRYLSTNAEFLVLLVRELLNRTSTVPPGRGPRTRRLGKMEIQKLLGGSGVR